MPQRIKGAMWDLTAMHSVRVTRVTRVSHNSLSSPVSLLPWACHPCVPEAESWAFQCPLAGASSHRWRPRYPGMSVIRVQLRSSPLPRSRKMSAGAIGPHARQARTKHIYQAGHLRDIEEPTACRAMAVHSSMIPLGPPGVHTCRCCCLGP